jgi:hypothetical protein
MDNCLLMIILGLIVFFAVVILYTKHLYKQQQSFTPYNIPGMMEKPQEVRDSYEEDLYKSQDTRLQFPLLPPVNPNIRSRRIQQVLPANSDLYSQQQFESSQYVLDTPPVPNTNQLIYSGGKTKMIEIPLQFNDPYNENLRTQDILITPYNRSKYGV